jgi:5-methylcytosine-specific restriction endonuclease McrA
VTTISQLSFDYGKKCNNCQVWKAFTEYGKSPRNKGGMETLCLPCSRARKRALRAKFRAEHPDRAKSEMAEWYAKKGVEYHQAWRNRNREKINENNRKRYAHDPQKNIDYCLHRSAVRRGAPGGNHTAAEWKALCERYDNRCLCCCGKLKLTRDHIVPVSQGGSDSIQNIQPLCKNCNSRKNDRHINYRPDRLIAAKVG